MISNAQSPKNNPGVTSDRWHVVHARWIPGEQVPQFDRSIVSEHDDLPAATAAAKALWQAVKNNMKNRPAETWDQLFVRRPGFVSLCRSARLVRRK